jgi:hypothetical protein
MLMRSALLWDITQRRVVILYRRFGTTHRSYRQLSISTFCFSLDFLTPDDGTDTLSRNVGKGFPLDAAQEPRRAQICSYLLFHHTFLSKVLRQYLIHWRTKKVRSFVCERCPFPVSLVACELSVANKRYCPASVSCLSLTNDTVPRLWAVCR